MLRVVLHYYWRTKTLWRLDRKLKLKTESFVVAMTKKKKEVQMLHTYIVLHNFTE